MRSDEKNGNLILNHNYFRHDSASGYYFVDGSTAYIGFFGADDVSDFHISTYAGMAPAPFFSGLGKVHSGFLLMYSACQNTVETWALDQQDNHGITDFVILGHSMGGGIALICASFLYEKLDPGTSIFCLTSANPKSFDPVTAFEFSSRIACRRIVNGVDQVPSLPQESLGFVHVGQYSHIGDEPNMLLGGTSMWINQHFVSDYANSLRKLGFSSNW